MPAQQKQTQAERNHELKMADHQAHMADVKGKQQREAAKHETEMAKHEVRMQAAQADMDFEAQQIKGLRRLSKMSREEIEGHVSRAIRASAQSHKRAHDQLVNNDDKHRRAKVRAGEQKVELGKTKPKIQMDPDLPTGKDIQAQINGLRLKSPRGLKKKITESTNTISEEHRHAAGVGERLLRAQSLQSTGKRIGTKPTPPTQEKTILKRAKRAARYDLRKKLAPNYSRLSTGQKQDIDERIARHADFKRLVDQHYKEYRKKYAQKASGGSEHGKRSTHKL